MALVFRIRDAEAPVVFACGSQRQAPVWAPAHDIGVCVSLAVVFPIADGANLIRIPLTKSFIAAARAPQFGSGRLTD